MKTAEEWIKEYSNDRLRPNANLKRLLVWHDGSLIKQIQLDAWKQGMMDAANELQRDNGHRYADTLAGAQVILERARTTDILP